MAGKAELGKAFIDELVGKLPAGQQDAVRTALSSPEAAAALEFAGSRLSPLDEERQRLSALQTQLTTTEQRLGDWKDRLGKWKADTEKTFTEREAALAAKERPSDGDPPPKGQDTTALTKDDIAKAVNEVLQPREAAYVTYVADATRLATFHLQQFKEPLDVNAIVRHPKIGELGFEGVYREVHKERLDKYAADKAAADREALKAELRKEIHAEAPVDMPYPIGEGSPLDALNLEADKRPKGDPAAAARMYEDLVRSGAGAR